MRTLRVDHGSRTKFQHLLFFVFILMEFTISVIVFVAGINFLLSQEDAFDIVSGVLGITFITEIDNKVYEIASIEDNPDANVVATSFRSSDFDVMNYLTSTNTAYEIPESMSEEAKTPGQKRAQWRAGIMKWILSKLGTNLMWPVLFVFVILCVLGLKSRYCDDDLLLWIFSQFEILNPAQLEDIN